MRNVERRSFSLPLRCNYLVETPDQATEKSLLFVALHGHGMTPEQMLRLSRPLAGDGHILVALQGPYQLWVERDGPERRVAFHWATSYEAEYSHRMHHDMLLHVLGEMKMPASRTVLLAFSQPVSLTYRFICAHNDAVHGAIGICGGIPGDWEKRPYGPTQTAVLHIATREDQFYPPAVTQEYAERLRTRIADVEFHLLDGAHRIPSSAAPLVQAWLERVFEPLFKTAS